MGEVVEHEIIHIRKLFFGSVCGQETSLMQCKVFHCFVKHDFSEPILWGKL